MRFRIISYIFLIVICFSSFGAPTYIQPRFTPNTTVGGFETMTSIDNFYYKDLYIRKDYNKGSHGGELKVSKVFLQGFPAMSSNHTSVKDFESNRINALSVRGIRQTCNVGLQFSEISEYLKSKTLGNPKACAQSIITKGGI